MLIYSSYLKEIVESLKIISQQGNRPFYFTQEFWTAAATIVAVFSPLLILWWSSRPKKNRLMVIGTSMVNQDPAQDNDRMAQNSPRILSVGRVIIKNKGKYKAQSAEAHIERIKFDGEERENFFPIPLLWTHGQLNKNGPTVKDIYPNQTVYLDIVNHVYSNDFIGDSYAEFAVAAGNNIENLSRVNLGVSNILVKIYQENGQIDRIFLKINWDGKNTPQLSII